MADMLDAFSSKGCKKLIVPLSNKLANLSRNVISVILWNCYQSQKQQLCDNPIVHASYNLFTN